jgi:3',5'-cyclic AMP phosphodiesterase CpdA
VCIATGDISTDGSAAGLATALEAFGRQRTTAGSAVERIETYPLGDYFRHRLVLPGNHDRFKAWRPLQMRSSRLEQTFGTSRSYPYLRAVKTGAMLPDVVFFVFDSTQNPDVLSRRAHFRFDRRIAGGVLLPGDWQWLHRVVADIAAGRPVPGIDGDQVTVNPDNCVRVAALHHHPVTPGADDPDKATMACEHGEEFADHCQQAGVQLILFGHRHRYFERRVPANGQRTQFGAGEALQLVCAPTALECASPTPGYLIYRITSGSIDVERYEWREAARDPRRGLVVGQGFHRVPGPPAIPI